MCCDELLYSLEESDRDRIFLGLDKFLDRGGWRERELQFGVLF